MFTGAFWKAAAERAIKTVAQVLLTFLGADVVNAFNVDYERAAGIAIGAAIISVLTSLISAGWGPAGPSLAGETIPVERI
jgi:hypothetical protein